MVKLKDNTVFYNLKAIMAMMDADQVNLYNNSQIHMSLKLGRVLKMFTIWMGKLLIKQKCLSSLEVRTTFAFLTL